ncbi:MAG: tRNA pseudouridine(38-40) synthase TruA [bacterium]|nr:tRNA pseudouridine(38-40) synthase TruA [bacterium]
MRLKFRVWYDGTDFLGWQIQPNLRTVEGELIAALNKISEREAKIYGAGRTDAGVHSTGQIAHCDVVREWDLQEFQVALNSNLPKDIFINEVQLAAPNFHARYSATSRTYVYRCTLQYNPLRRNFEYFLKRLPDLDKLQESLQYLVGTFDFQAFIQYGSDPDTICTIYTAKCELDRNNLRFIIHADRFGWKMVRKIVGTCLAISYGRFPISILQKMLQGEKEPKIAPVPPHGLFLAGVTYPKELGGPPELLEQWFEATNW